MARKLIRGIAIVTAVAVALPSPSFAQPKPAPGIEVEAKEFNVEQLDAMLAPIALYPDELLTQMLMASTYPLQVVAAARWLEKDDNKKLKGMRSSRRSRAKPGIRASNLWCRFLKSWQC
jgi:Protein of unknown function (DUF3300)